jgi:hypothetical protein
MTIFKKLPSYHQDVFVKKYRLFKETGWSVSA